MLTEEDADMQHVRSDLSRQLQPQLVVNRNCQGTSRRPSANEENGY